MAFERLNQRWLRASAWIEENPREATVFAIAHMVFIAAAVAFALIFWRQERTVSLVRYGGAAVTLWASLHGLYYFMLSQAPTAKEWFRGLAVVFLGVNILLCLGLMASHSSVLIHGLVIHVVLTMYVVWDLIARKHYRPRSGQWFSYYEKLLTHDRSFWIWYGFCAYLAFIPGVRSFMGFASVPVDVLSDWLTLIVLVAESLDFAQLSTRSTVNANYGNGVFDVVDGYQRWAPLYDKGNAVITVERDHTGLRLKDLPIQGKTVVDFGCGIGHYLAALLDAGAAKVFGIESNAAMIARIPGAIKSDARVQIIEGGVAALGHLTERSIDGVFCALVVDHLRDHDYRDFLQFVARVLRSGGWLYISDVNPYFELREHCYARFLDESGVEKRIRVFPHSVAETLQELRRVGFSHIELREGQIAASATSSWEELKDLSGFPLIIEYFAIATNR